jgi:predicted RNA-binding Zn-ribbon protein involved in translation (DUF1610 family)
MGLEDWYPKPKPRKIPCPNCGKKVRYGSQHCRGTDELNAYWICEKK